MWCLWAAIDIFSNGISMVYLKVKVYLSKETNMCVSVSLVGSVLDGIEASDMCNICMDYDGCQKSKYVI